MIQLFYKLTFPRRHTNQNKLHKLFNMFIYAEYLLVGALCNFFLKHFYPKCKKQLNREKRKDEIIVSMTTIPSRLDTLPLMLKCMFNQSLMPDRIILWITDKINDRSELLSTLHDEIQAGLEVRFVEDVRVHTKYYYAMLEYPEAIIITVDDDIIYPENLIQRLYCCHQTHPKCVVAARAHEITTTNETILPYRQWNMLAPGTANKSNKLLATGVGGVLYPPHTLYTDWKDTSLFLKLCPTADDIWLKLMERLNNISVVKLDKYTREPFIIGKTQTIALSKANVGEGRNDILLGQCTRHYHINAELFRD